MCNDRQTMLRERANHMPRQCVSCGKIKPALSFPLLNCGDGGRSIRKTVCRQCKKSERNRRYRDRIAKAAAASACETVDNKSTETHADPSLIDETLQRLDEARQLLLQSGHVECPHCGKWVPPSGIWTVSLQNPLESNKVGE